MYKLWEVIEALLFFMVIFRRAGLTEKTSCL